MEWYEAFRNWVGESTRTPLPHTEDEDEHAYLCRLFDRSVREAFHAGWELNDAYGQDPRST